MMRLIVLLKVKWSVQLLIDFVSVAFMSHIVFSGFLTMYDTNQAEKPQRMVRGLKFGIYAVEGYCTIYALKIKAMISCR